MHSLNMLENFQLMKVLLTFLLIFLDFNYLHYNKWHATIFNKLILNQNLLSFFSREILNKS